MTPDIKKYPLDLTACAITNKVSDEKKTIQSPPDRLITLTAGIFYAKGLVINYPAENKILEYGVDFILNYIHEDITIRSGSSAYSLIVIKNQEIKGDLLITYQAVGGEYTKLDDAILKVIDDLNNTDIIVLWDMIVNKPLTYPPEGHLHLADDIVGCDDIVHAINEIAGAIQGERPTELEKIYEIMDTKVTNMNYMRFNQVNEQWLLTSQTPLRISAKPFPSAIALSIDIWQDDIGHSNVEISGELSPDGIWKNKHYRVIKGSVPSIELQLIVTDGSSAEILVRTTSSLAINIIPTSIVYLKHRPEISSITCSDMSSIGVPIPDEFVVPIKE